MTSSTNSAVLQPAVVVTFGSREQEIDRQSEMLIGKMLAGTITPEESAEYQYLQSERSKRMLRVRRR